jgi:hypothetical protein
VKPSAQAPSTITSPTIVFILRRLQGSVHPAAAS